MKAQRTPITYRLLTRQNVNESVLEFIDREVSADELGGVGAQIGETLKGRKGKPLKYRSQKYKFQDKFSVHLTNNAKFLSLILVILYSP
jgi:hypothetical protein